LALYVACGLNYAAQPLGALAVTRLVDFVEVFGPEFAAGTNLNPASDRELEGCYNPRVALLDVLHSPNEPAISIVDLDPGLAKDIRHF
jgi:hypothetical protein